jgi:hypothetical protein
MIISTSTKHEVSRTPKPGEVSLVVVVVSISIEILRMKLMGVFGYLGYISPILNFNQIIQKLRNQ